MFDIRPLDSKQFPGLNQYDRKYGLFEDERCTVTSDDIEELADIKQKLDAFEKGGFCEQR